MKLYTEEQVREAIKKSYEPKNKDGNALEYWYSTEEVIAFLTPIELTSDEEIYEASFLRDGSDYSLGEHSGFIKGAKWMKEQITK